MTNLRKQNLNRFNESLKGAFREASTAHLELSRAVNTNFGHVNIHGDQNPMTSMAIIMNAEFFVEGARTLLRKASVTEAMDSARTEFGARRLERRYLARKAVVDDVADYIKVVRTEFDSREDAGVKA